MITAKNISKSYGGKSVLNDIDFAAAGGESVVIVGRNGAGKSTFLSILAGYLKPDSGCVEAAGGGVAFCPQQDNLFEELSVRDNLLFWERAKGRPVGSNIEELVRVLGINEYAKKKVRHLSGGMKKSVAIVCALSGGADVLILDEPFSGLDIFYKDELLKALEELRRSGKCIIYTSHNIDEIMGLDSKIYTLSGGKLAHIDDIAKDSGNDAVRASLLEHSKA